MLKLIKNMNIGVETASLGEIYIAEQAGFTPDKIVFDSPAKTIDEIEYALKKGIYLNADSFEELDRIDELLKRITSDSLIGVRINPQTGVGSIKSTSVSGTVSKFGIPLNDHRDELKASFKKYPWLTGVHVHIGSQGCPVDLMIMGIRKVLDFTVETNIFLDQEKSSKRINFFDIGGGLPVSYHPATVPVKMEAYRDLLAQNCPELFSGEFKLITEFGRYIHANCGWTISVAEYVKHEKEHNIIMIHVGADLLLRKSYNPDDWHHEIRVMDQTGTLKTGKDKKKFMVAGPLCFAGDIIASDIELPTVETGNLILIKDTGAYTLSMWSRYNNRQIPKVIGYFNYGKSYKFLLLKDREKLDSVYKFWS
jgi:diaminopimelate decarboxylase